MERRKVKHLHIIDNVKKILIIFLCLIITIIVFRMTYSSYETRATSKADLGVAFFVVKENFDSMTVNLNEMIEPGQDGTNPSQYTFTFKVQNYNDERRTEVTTYYDLTLKITRNENNISILSGSINIDGYEIPLNYNVSPQEYLNTIDRNLVEFMDVMPDARDENNIMASKRTFHDIGSTQTMKSPSNSICSLKCLRTA